MCLNPNSCRIPPLPSKTGITCPHSASEISLPATQEQDTFLEILFRFSTTTIMLVRTKLLSGNELRTLKCFIPFKAHNKLIKLNYFKR